jgi:hypothetical protein
MNGRAEALRYDDLTDLADLTDLTDPTDPTDLTDPTDPTDPSHPVFLIPAATPLTVARKAFLSRSSPPD